MFFIGDFASQGDLGGQQVSMLNASQIFKQIVIFHCWQTVVSEVEMQKKCGWAADIQGDSQRKTQQPH